MDMRLARTVAAVVVVLALGCRAPVASGAGCKLATVAEWPIRMERGMLLVDGAINGQPARIMLDTGATRTLLLRAAATRFNVTRADSKSQRMFGVDGETKVEIAFLDEFRVGELARTSFRMLIAGDRDFGADVLLGEDFLSLVDVEFDLEHNTVRLFQPENCEGKKLAYWATTAASVKEVAMDAIQLSRPQIVLDVAINGQNISTQLDSGAAFTVLDKPAAARLGVTPETPGVVAEGKSSGLGGKVLPVWSGTFQSFTIGNETVQDVQLRFSELFRDASHASLGTRIPTKLEGVQQMLLGVDFLRSHRVLVAHSQRRIYFTHNGGPVFGRSGPTDAKNDASPGADMKPPAPAN
jgi:predicted aspartyl protease